MIQPLLNKILYIEDEPDIRMVTQIALETIAGFKLKICASGTEALKCAADFSPDLVLLDVMMPGMDGPATFQALRKIPQLLQTPAVFMTAKVEAVEIKQLIALGAIDVVKKPFDPMTLGQTIRTIWDRQFSDVK